MAGLGRFDQFEVICAGALDPVAGYLIDIKEVDRAVRGVIGPRLAQAAREPSRAQPAGLLRAWLPELNAALRGLVHSVRWFLSPTYSLRMTMPDLSSVELHQRFEFAASHRLHVAGLSDEENRRLFGKCNHKNGHGHNYIFELAVAIPVDERGAQPVSVAQIERLGKELVLDRFDHKHLNLDIPEFREDGGLNPSVENIARVIYEILGGRIAGLGAGVSLSRVTVWESDRTSAVYPAGN